MSKNKIEEIENVVRKIKEIESNIKKLEMEKPNIELRIFGDNGWSKFDFKPNHKPTENFVFNQINISLKADLKIEKQKLKNIVSEI